MTAFFFPNLLSNDNGSVDIDFEVPDSVTSWTLWLQALTKDLNSGTKSFQIESIKDLIVRPYLPRFLREGDKAQIKIVVTNASEKVLSGLIDMVILDAAMLKDASSNFNISKNKNISFCVEPKKRFNLSLPITVPAESGLVNFKVVAKTKTLSDGKVRPLPILPGRFHLMQWRFVTLKNNDQRQMTFPDLVKNVDPSLINEKLVVQVDAQLFYSVLSAIPYLVNYPYECVEQNLERFSASGIMNSIFKRFSTIEKMAQSMSKRKTKFESFDESDPNRKMVDQKLLPVIFQKETPGIMFASTIWQFSTEKLPTKSEGNFLNVDRSFLLRQAVGNEMHLTPLSQGQKIHVGDEIEVHISLKSKHPVDYIHLRDPRGAGFEPTSVNS